MYQLKNPLFTILIFILSASMLVFSCASKQETTTKEEMIIKSDPKLLFLNYQMQKLNDKTNITLINQITTDGKLKDKTKTQVSTTVGDLECLVLDERLIQLERHTIKNPLKKIVEFINDAGELEKRQLDLDSAQFSLKLQLHPKARYIIINEITETNPIKHISTKIE